MTAPAAKTNTKPIRTLLTSGAPGRLGALYEHAARLERMSRLVQDHLPASLGHHCRVAEYTGRTLVLHTDSPAWNTRLRYLSPQLLEQLRRLPGFEDLATIRIKTRPTVSAAPPPRQAPSPRRPRGLPPGAVPLLTALADAVSSPALKRALRRLAGHAEEP